MADVTPLCVSGDGRVRPFSSSAGDTLVGAGGGGGGGSLPFDDDEPLLADADDATITAQFVLPSGLATSTARTYTLPAEDGTLALVDELTSLLDISEGAATSSRTATIPQAALDANGKMVRFRARGIGVGTVSMEVGGESVTVPIAGNGDASAWELYGEIRRVSSSSVAVYATVLWHGLDADVGSADEVGPGGREVIALGGINLDANDCNVTVASTSTGVEMVYVYALTYGGVGGGGGGVGEWEAFTPVGSWTTNVTYAGKMRRVGDEIQCRVYVVINGAVGTPGALYITPPVAVATSKLNTTMLDEVFESQVIYHDSGIGEVGPGVVRYRHSEAKFYVSHPNSSHALAQLTHSSLVTPAAGDRISLVWSYPVAA